MNKLFKTKIFLIVEGIMAMFIVFPFLIGIKMPILEPLKKLLVNLFGMCKDMGPTPESGGSGLPCFFKDLLIFDIIILIPIAIIYFIIFMIYKRRNKKSQSTIN